MNINTLKVIVVLSLTLLFTNNNLARRIGVSIAQTKQADQYNTEKKPLTQVQESIQPDKFTQTEAHLQVKKVKELMTKEDSSRYIPYLDIMSDCIAKEVELKDTHSVFYHATENAWRVPQDLYTQLSAYTNKAVPATYLPLRYGEFPSQHAKEFLINELKENGLVDDTGKAGAYILSVNLSLFGNVGFEPECTWAYFLREKMHRIPDKETYASILKGFNLTDKYIDELLELPKLFETKQKTILQIFVPKNKVDDIGYLSVPTGIPATDKQVHEWARQYVKSKKMSKAEEKTKFTTQWLAEHFKQEQERNPQFKELMDRVKAGDYSVNKYLKMFCNAPWDLPYINYIQARLLFTPDILLNPNAGVEIYRYSTAEKKQLEEYFNRLKSIIDKIIQESKGA